MRPWRVYIVEDEALVAMEIESRLTEQGYDVVGVEAVGEFALQEIACLAPDVVLLDICLAGDLSGIGVASRLGPDGPAVVFLTAYADTDLVTRAADAGAYGYLIKPFSAPELHATLQVTLRRRLAAREQQARAAEQLSTQAHRASERLTQIAGGVAHRLSNDLSAAMGLLHVARQEIKDCAAEADLVEAGRALDRSGVLAHRLRNLGHATAQLEGLDLSTWLASLAAQLRPLVRQGQRLTVECDAAGVGVTADPRALGEAVRELVANAAEATPPDGTVSVRARVLDAHEVTDLHVLAPGWACAAPHLAALEVRNEGPGIDAALLQRLGEPFFTTKGIGRGLGLAFATTVAVTHRGALAVRTGRAGSTFLLLLPSSMADAQAQR